MEKETETYYIYDASGSFVELLEGESDEEIRAHLDADDKYEYTFDKGSE